MHRLYTRTQDFDLFDLTELDFPSSPPLHYYVKHWYTNIDELIEYLPFLSDIFSLKSIKFSSLENVDSNIPLIRLQLNTTIEYNYLSRSIERTSHDLKRCTNKFLCMSI